MSSHKRDPARVKVLLVFADEIYTRSLQAALAALPGMDHIRTAASVIQARTDIAHRSPDIVLLDCELPGALEFADELGISSPTRLLLCARSRWSDRLTGLSAFATGMLTTDRLTPDAMDAAVGAINAGHAVVGVDLLRMLCGAFRDAGGRVSGATRHGKYLSERERTVISLVAEGGSSREIARQLDCSERTVKTILRGALTKLGARNRTHGVAVAVRRKLV